MWALRRTQRSAFTIVELIVAIAIVATLAAISVIGYGAWRTSIQQSQVKSELTAAASAMEAARNASNGYPGTLPSSYTPNKDVTVTIFSVSSSKFCLDGVSNQNATVKYYIDSAAQAQGPVSGDCASSSSATVPAAPTLSAVNMLANSLSISWATVPGTLTSYVAQCATDPAFIVDIKTATVSGSTTTATIGGVSLAKDYYCRVRAESAIGYGAWSNLAPSVIAMVDGSFMQAITDANCPATRTRAVDARDNHTYWVQKLADGKCWMLTNLGYAGGGTNTYSDTKTLTNGTGGSTTYAVASYYVVPSTTNFTTEPAAPSTATNGTGQYGYLYNWCAAMGDQQSTGACLNTTTPAPSTNISICPAGWRLPVGNVGEFTALNTAVNGGMTNTDQGLRENWLAQRSGSWTGSGFGSQGNNGYYWSSLLATAGNAFVLNFSSSSVNPSNSASKVVGFAIRCITV